MIVEALNKKDFDQIYTELQDFWDERATTIRSLHHPIFLYEFGDTAFVIRENDSVVAYLYGMLSQTSPTGYIHLIGVRNTHRRKKLAQTLYQHFIKTVKAKGCNRVKAMTTIENVGEPNELGTPVVSNYRGPNEHRIVFEMEI